MANADCLLDRIKNHLRDKFLGMSLRKFLDWANWDEKTHHRVGWDPRLNEREKVRGTAALIWALGSLSVNTMWVAASWACHYGFPSCWTVALSYMLNLSASVAFIRCFVTAKRQVTNKGGMNGGGFFLLFLHNILKRFYKSSGDDFFGWLCASLMYMQCICLPKQVMFQDKDNRRLSIWWGEEKLTLNANIRNSKGYGKDSHSNTRSHCC